MTNQASPVVLKLWDNFQTAYVMSERADKAWDNIRNDLIQRHGDLKRGESCESRWGHDPDFSLLSSAVEKSNEMNDQATDCMDELMAYPAKSVPDLAMKLAAVLHVWRQTRSLKTAPEYHEHLALVLLNDAEKVLWPDVPVLEGAPD